MAGTWIKLSGESVYALNMNHISDVEFGDFTDGSRAILHSGDRGEHGNPRLILLGEADARIVKQWLDSHAIDTAVAENDLTQGSS
jgi:hypothetical protein